MATESKESFFDFKKFVRDHYENTYQKTTSVKISEFIKDASILSEEDKTKFAQLMLRNFCNYRPDIELAKFYLDQMKSTGAPPADAGCEHPILHELAHQCESFLNEDVRDLESELLVMLMEHPCYEPYLHNPKYTDKYRFTFLDRYLVSQSSHLDKEDTPLRLKLKEKFPDEYPILEEKALNSRTAIDQHACYRGFRW